MGKIKRAWQIAAYRMKVREALSKASIEEVEATKAEVERELKIRRKAK